jgi:hypothetical protein
VLVQAARRYRALSPATKQRHYSAKEGRVKTHSRELRQDVVLTLGRTLYLTLGVIGRKIAEGAEREHQSRAVAWQEAYAALRPAA